MSIKMDKEVGKYLIGSIKRFFTENTDNDIGDLKVSLVLGFFLREIGPGIYKQGIADAQAYFQDKAADLGGVRYETEFDCWKK